MISNSGDTTRQFVSIGMFIIDEFSFADEKGNPTGKSMVAQVSSKQLNGRSNFRSYTTLTLVQIGGGGTYASIGARIW